MGEIRPKTCEGPGITWEAGCAQSASIVLARVPSILRTKTASGSDGPRKPLRSQSVCPSWAVGSRDWEADEVGVLLDQPLEVVLGGVVGLLIVAQLDHHLT